MTTNSTHPAMATDPADIAAPMPTPRTDDERPTMSQPTASGSMTEENIRAADGLLSDPRPGTAADDPSTGDRGTGNSPAGVSLIAPEHAEGYRARWAGVQGNFIDEPRTAVIDADALVGVVLDQLEATFRAQREALEQQWADNESTTEDLRVAMRRYRTFFDRLLSL